ncbi:hypothetical protein [Pontibacter rugosus]
MKKYLIPFILIFLFTSCDKEETIDFKENLIKHDWEQVTGIVDNVYYGSFKQFHKIKFHSDNTYEVILDYGGVSEFPDQVRLDTLYGRYFVDKNIINFHGPIDTLYKGNKGIETKVFINNWRINILDSKTLRTEPIDNYYAPEQPAFITGVSSYLFKPLKQ